MKKILSLILCLILLLTPVTPSVIADEGNSVVAENVSDFLDEYITETDLGNGLVEYTMSPLMAGMTARDVAAAAGITTQTAPVYDMGAFPDYYFTTGQTHTPISIEQRYLYSLLDEEWKGYYRQLDEAIRNRQATVDFTGIDGDELSDMSLYFLYMFDNPELFFLGLSVSQRNYSLNDNKCGYILCYGISPDDYYYPYNMSWDPEQSVYPTEFFNRLSAKCEEFNQAVKDFLSVIPSNAPEVVKERLIYSKILLESHYNLAALGNDVKYYPVNDNWTSYGIICNGYGVCESYAEAFQTLCNAAGIECTSVVGTAGGGHKWNAVKISGRWYQCDVTFDDPIGGDPDAAYCHYFNLTDEQMAKDGHDWSSCDFAVPVCTATEYVNENYIARFGDDGTGKTHCFSNACDDSCNNCDYTRWIPGHDFVNGVCKKCSYGAAQGWRWENGKWYFYRDDERVCKEWVNDSKGPCYLDWDGALVTESFVYDENGEEVCYVDASGHILRNAWRDYYGSWFYLDGNGKRAENRWLLWKNEWYFLDDYGLMVTDCWKKDSKGWVFLKSDGRMAKNRWVEWNGGWYFLNADGYMVTNVWKKDSKGWVYLGADGKMKTNAWVRDSVGWCYVDYDGYCVTDEWRQDSTGGWCYLNKNGNMVVNNWVYRNGCWYYCNKNGYRVTGRQVIGGKEYYFSEHGFLL